jgi:ABC-type multidrug transport system fused ATPase/permease subunit
MIKFFSLLWNYVDKNFYLKIIFLNLMYFINSLVQLVYILSVVPIISFITSTNSQTFSKFTNKILIFGKIFFDSEILIFFLFFIFSSLIANMFIIILNFFNFSFNQVFLSKLRKKLFLIYSNSNYLFINSNNLSYYNTIIFQQVDRFVNNVLGSINLILQNLFTILIILFSIFFIIKGNSFFIFAIVSTVFIGAVFISKKYFSVKGSELNSILKGRLDILNKLILNFKEIKIYGIKNYLFSRYEFYEDNFNKNIKFSNFINHSSKPFIEIVSVICFALLIYLNLDNLHRGDFVIQISIIIFALYKILPSANVIYTSVNQIIYDRSSIDIIYEQFSKKKEIVNYLETEDFFKESLKSISIENLQFSYGPKEIIKNFSYKFHYGNFYLIKGASGSGKTTFLNLLMGIIKFKKGDIYFNDRRFDNFNNLSWFNLLSYVPQNITLLNNTLEENITFSFSKNFDKKKYEAALRQVNIYDELATRQNEIIDEYSSNLSGGQVQRIGLARALYKDSKILLLDEPTSNLDVINEFKFLNIVESLKKDRIIIMISHKNHENIKFDDILNF